MASGTLEFTARADSLRLDPIEIYVTPHSAVEKIIVKTEKEKGLVVVFHLTDIFTEDRARDIAENFLDAILNRLAFDFDVSIGPPYGGDYKLPKDEHGSMYTLGKSLRLSWQVAAPTVNPNLTKRQDLEKCLEQPYTLHDPYYCAYRFAISVHDPVTRFLFLYSTLLQIILDKQGKDTITAADNLIRLLEPGVLQTLSPHTGKGETIYTRLRNEVGHARPGVAPSNTYNEIEKNV